MAMRRWLIASAAIVFLASLTGGCASYDYLQRTDRISYRAGNAVKANLEAETINPSSGAMYDVSGLGKNGSVIPAETGTASTGGGSSTPAPKPGAETPTVQ